MHKTIFATLAKNLYDSCLSRDKKSIIDEVQTKGVLHHQQEDQIAVVCKIMVLIDVDPIAVVYNLITFSTAVPDCRRNRTEDLCKFVSCFRGLEAEYLMHKGLSACFLVGEVLAVTLVKNANVS